MSEMADILKLREDASRRGEQHAFATVISTDGPAYRSAGSRSLVVESGTFKGGISAGCLESDIACRLDGNAAPFIVTYDLSEEDDIRGFPFGCGGTIQIFVEPLPNPRAVDAVVWLTHQREPAVLCTVVQVLQDGNVLSPHELIGARYGTNQSGSDVFQSKSDFLQSQPDFFLSNSDFFRHSLDELEEFCRSAFAEAKSKLFQLHANDITLRVFAEYREPEIELMIFGDGEDARALQTLADQVGMSVQRIGKRALREENFFSGDNDVYAKAHVAIMTHDLHLDTFIMRHFLQQMPPYLGIMGPKSRTRRIIQSLDKDPETIFSAPPIYAPVGLNMAAETPQEIALSILAEVQMVAKKVSPTHLRDEEGPIHHRWQNRSTSSDDASDRVGRQVIA